MADLLDILTNNDSFDLLGDANAASVITNTNGIAVLKNQTAASALQDDVFSRAIQHTDFVETTKSPGFGQKNNFETIKNLVSKPEPDDRLPYALQSIINNSATQAKTGEDLTNDKTLLWKGIQDQGL